jgi:DNA polymerase-1
MQHRGIIVNSDYLKELKNNFIQEKERLELAVHQQVGQNFSLSSTKQLREILFEKLGYPVVEKTPKGLASTNESALVQLAKDYPVCQLLLQWRHFDKLISTYTDSLIEKVEKKTGAIHTQYHQTGTITGRLSSSEPNLQNIPIKTEQGRMIRKAFEAREGKVLLAADYSQIELRLIAHFSQDPSLLKAYHSNEDIHQLTASKIYHCSLEEVDAQMRRNAKMVNFGLIYGMSPWGLSRHLQVDLKTADLFHRRFFDKYPKVKEYMEKMENMAKEDGYVKTLLGRKINVRLTKNAQMNLRSAINGPLQGTASDLIKKAMIRLEELFAHRCEIAMLMQVHDELVFEVHQDKVSYFKPIIKQQMENALSLTVPIEVNFQVSQKWSDG